MTLLLREEDVRSLLPMGAAIEAVRQALTAESAGDPENLPRKRIPLGKGSLNVMAASVPSVAAVGLKAYTVASGSAHFVVALWDQTGTLLAIMEADWLGRIRTGAASGVATDALASPTADTLAVIGSGRQARTQIEAVQAVRSIREIRVYSRTPEHAQDLCDEIERGETAEVRRVASAEDAVADADIVVTITSAATPVLEGSWLKPTCHVNAAGSNFSDRRELASSVIARAGLIAVDSTEQARLEAGDLLIPIQEGVLGWGDVRELGAVLREGKRDDLGDEITIFKSLGIAIEDVAVARHVYDEAIRLGIGETTTFGELNG